MHTAIGRKAKDKISGFAGVITGYAEYISGCAQFLIAPEVGKDGALRDGAWLDAQRVEIDQRAKPVALDNTKTPGPDRAPVRRY